MQIPGSFDFQIVFAEVTSHLKINYIQIVIVEEAFGLIGANMMLPDKAGDVERCEGEVANMEVDNVADKEVDEDKAGDVERCETEGEIWRELSEMELDDFSLTEEVWSREASQFVVDRAGEDVFWKAL